MKEKFFSLFLSELYTELKEMKIFSHTHMSSPSWLLISFILFRWKEKYWSRKKVQRAFILKEKSEGLHQIGSLNARNWEEMVFIERFWLILFHVFVWECSFQILLKLHWDLLRKKQANIQKA